MQSAAVNPAQDGTAPQVSREAEGEGEASKCHLPVIELRKVHSFKATEFKSSVALAENGIKGWTINLSYSQVTGHLRAKILMGSLPPLLSPCNRCVIHGSSFCGLHFHLITFSLLLLSDSFVSFLRGANVRTSTAFVI